MPLHEAPVCLFGPLSAVRWADTRDDLVCDRDDVSADHEVEADACAERRRKASIAPTCQFNLGSELAAQRVGYFARKPCGIPTPRRSRS